MNERWSYASGSTYQRISFRSTAFTGVPTPPRHAGTQPERPVGRDRPSALAVVAGRPLRLGRGGGGAGIGKPVKGVLRKLMRWYVEPLAYDQRTYNAALLRLVDDLEGRIDELEAELAAARGQGRRMTLDARRGFELLRCPTCRRPLEGERTAPLQRAAAARIRSWTGSRACSTRPRPASREALEAEGWAAMARDQGWYEPDDDVDAVLPYVYRDLGWDDLTWGGNEHSFGLLLEAASGRGCECSRSGPRSAGARST